MTRQGLFSRFFKIFSGTVVFLALRFVVTIAIYRFGLPPALLGTFMWLGLLLIFIMPGRWLYLPVAISTAASVINVFRTQTGLFNPLTSILTNQLVMLIIAEFVIQNLDRLRKSNAILAEARTVAESATKKKDVFLAYMSHEIRNPLSGIIGMTDLLLEGTRGEKRKFLNMIRESSMALQRIIEDLLDLSVMEADGVVLQREVLPLRDYLYDLCTLFSIDAKSKGVSFVSDIRCTDGCYLIDRVRFRQIIGNLLSNAFKFTPEGGLVRLAVASEQGEGGSEVCKIAVSDTGPGIPAQEQRRIFDSFYRTDASNRGGAGLGLFIVRKMVEVFGGTVIVRSQPGKGATFEITIPIERTESVSSDISESPELVSGEGKRVLVAEDNTINAAYICILLEKAGFTIDIARDGLEAVAMYKEHLHDIALLDISMPKMGGDEALVRIREICNEAGKTLFALAVTGFVTEPEREAIKAVGFDAVIHKPVDSKLLLSILAANN